MPARYPAGMPCLPHRLGVALAACLVAGPACAAKVARIDIQGVADPAVAQNVRTALSLNDELDKDLSARRLNYLLRQAERETREALEPFGYYSPTITIRRSDRDLPVGQRAEPPATDADAGDDPDDGDEAGTDGDAPAAASTTPRRDPKRTLTVDIEIVLGEPVRVRREQVDVDGPGAGDGGVREALAAFAPRAGAVLDHTVYEAGKKRISNALLQHGYFDADLASHRVEVTRADFAADIDLRWTTGERYRLGEARFQQDPKPIIRDDLLQKLVNWEPGAPYDAAKLDRLRRSLVALDYFGLVDVSALPENASERTVPVEVSLSPAPRSIYTVGASYGTVSGPGVNLGVERRYINSLGHKALAQLDYAKDRKALTLQYKVPAFAWLDGWYTASLQAVDEVNTYINSRRVEFVASRSGQYNDHLNLLASLHVLRERWLINVADDGEGGLAPVPYRYGSYVFPALEATYVDVDDRLDPRRGAGGTLLLRGGRGGADGNTTFLQVHARVQWFHGFDADSKLLLRGEAGHTFSGSFLDLPPSLRFYAGGDRSVRGYDWHEIGPRVEVDGDVYYTGASNVVTASVEYERYFKGPWGAAVFVDSGSAFEGKRPDMHTGVGVGVRWRSPVGPVRIDIARGLKAPDSPFTLHFAIGADL